MLVPFAIMLTLAGAMGSPLPQTMGEGGQSVLEQPTAEPTGDADAMQRQAEASIEQVEGDLKRMTTFNAEVRRSLDESDRAKIDVQHALGYFRRQQELHQDERDTARARVVRIEEEVRPPSRRACGRSMQTKHAAPSGSMQRPGATLRALRAGACIALAVHDVIPPHDPSED